MILSMDKARERYPTGTPCLVLNVRSQRTVKGTISGIRPNGCPIVDIMAGGLKSHVYFDSDWTSHGGVYELLAVYRN